MRLCIAVLILSLGVVAGDGAMAQGSGEAIGEVERQRGSATRSSGGDTVALAVGSPVYEGDTITSGPDARLQIRFNDDSNLTISQNASVLLDDFTYTGRFPEQKLEMLKGVFRFVTGAIAKETPTSFRLRTPVATIGVRGTEFVGGELTVGMPPGTAHYGFQITDGAIAVISPGGTVVLDEPGEGTFLPLARVAAPTEPRIWSPAAAAEPAELLRF